MELDLPSKLRKALEREASDANRTLHAHIIRKLENITPPAEFIKPKVVTDGFPVLIGFLDRVPSVSIISSEICADFTWWVKLKINIEHAIAWKVVQELGFVLNYISIEEKLPTLFMPVSPPPYMNGGPEDFLSWVIEAKYNYIDPAWIASELEARLPSPVEDLTKWEGDS
jgi:hypothetical protein